MVTGCCQTQVLHRAARGASPAAGTGRGGAGVAMAPNLVVENISGRTAALTGRWARPASQECSTKNNLMTELAS